MQKKIILTIIIVLVLIIGIYQGFLKKETPKFTLVETEIGNITQEISETGQVKKGEETNLNFKNAGRIEKIYVAVNDEVKSGEKLIKLEATQLQIQLQESKASLSLVQAGLDKLLTGASPEEIQVAETTVANAQTSLESSQQNLKDVQSKAEESLDSAYEDVVNSLDDSYLEADNASTVIVLLQKTYFTENYAGGIRIEEYQEGIMVRENKDEIEKAVADIKSYIGSVDDNNQHYNIDLAVSGTKEALKEIQISLRFIREICEQSSYYNTVSATDKTSLDTQKSYINTALTNITNFQQAIASAKATNETNINISMASVSTAQGVLKTAQDKLSLLVASPRQEDVNSYQAQVKQAQAQVQLLENQIQESTLKSPIEGQIIKINKKIGEMVQPALPDAVIILLPTDPFEIEVDIYEEDIIKINIGNQVDISLVAFPDQVFKGRVISLEPTEKLIEGIVYYEVTVAFEQIPNGINPGMTADIIIKTASRENVLTVLEDAVQKKEGKTIVEIFKDGVIESREIETGLLGSNDMIEVISGLEEGEKIILR